jgi:solute carrier family 8 (sodium/calcium exchanger)
LFAVVVPPPEFGGGWPCFLVSIAMFVFLVASLLDLTELFSCVAGIQDSVTGLTLVSIGTSLPDLFVSITAAKHNEWADASIVNVTGSNSVNILLGIGLPWTMAAIFWSGQTGSVLDDWKRLYPHLAEDYPNGAFVVEGGDLGFNVGVFTVGAFLCFLVLRVRRFKYHGELGGPTMSKAFTAAFLVFCWLVYVLLCVWKAVFDFKNFGDQASTALTPENIITAFAITVMMAFTVTAIFDLWSGDWWRYTM